MRNVVIAAGMAALLASCAKPGPPPKPQPGSWSIKTELLDIQGQDAEKIKVAMVPMLGMMNHASMCLTPENAVKSDPVTNIIGGNGDCKLERNDVSAAGVHVAGTCTKDGVPSRFAADGTIATTAQDMTITSNAPSPLGGGALTIKMRARKQRTGDCKPGDMPAPPGMM